MSIDNIENSATQEQVSDDLDAFSSSFFGQKVETDSTAKEDVAEDTAKDSATTEEDTQPIEDDDTLAMEDDDAEDQGDEKPAPVKKNRFQERIDELNAKFREEERKRQDTERRLDELTRKLDKTDEPVVKTPVVAQENDGPDPDALTDTGEAKYPLGEFDPQYIRDLTRYTIESERKAIEAREAQKVEQNRIEEERTKLHTEWSGKVETAQERYPDFQEKGQTLLGTFESIDPTYGEYLSATIMSLDYGTDVLYYLANNPDEAKKIVESGATKATVALGRLEARFAASDDEKQPQVRSKVSKAPTPPVHVNKGASAAKLEVPDDTDDLDAFAAKMFKTKRGA